MVEGAFTFWRGQAMRKAMRKAVTWWWHEVVWRGRLHDWRLEVPTLMGEPTRFRCACGAEKEIAVGGWPSHG